MEDHLKADLTRNQVKVAFQCKRSHLDSRAREVAACTSADHFRLEQCFKILNLFRAKDITEMKHMLSEHFPKVICLLDSFPNDRVVTETSFFQIIMWWLCGSTSTNNIATLCKEIKGGGTPTIDGVVKIIRTLCFLDANESHHPLGGTMGDIIRMESACVKVDCNYNLICVLAISVTTLNVRLCHFLAENNNGDNEENLLRREEILRKVKSSVSKSAKIVVSKEYFKKALRKSGFLHVETMSLSSHPHGLHFQHFLKDEIRRMFHADNLSDRNLLNILMTEFVWRQNIMPDTDDERFCKVLFCLHKACERIDNDISGSTMYNLLNNVADNAGQEDFTFSSLTKTLLEDPVSVSSDNMLSNAISSPPPSTTSSPVSSVGSGSSLRTLPTLNSLPQCNNPLDDSTAGSSADNFFANENVEYVVEEIDFSLLTPSNIQGLQNPSETCTVMTVNTPAVRLITPTKHRQRAKVTNDVAQEAGPSRPKRNVRLSSNKESQKHSNVNELSDSAFSPPPSPPIRAKRRKVNDQECQDPEIHLDTYYYATINIPPEESRPESLKSLPQWKPVQCRYCPPANKNGLITRNKDLIPHMLIQHCKQNGNIWEFIPSECNRKVSNAKTCFICCTTTEKGIINSHMSSVHQKNVETSCRICEKDFDEPIHQQKHFKELHSPAEMPYWCPICDAKSSYRSDIIDHYFKIHTQEQIVLCPFCLYSFKCENADDINALESHILKHKNESNMFTCIKCTLNFVSEDDYNMHQDHNHTLVFNLFGDMEKVMECFKNFEVRKAPSKNAVMVRLPERKSLRNIKRKRTWENLSGLDPSESQSIFLSSLNLNPSGIEYSPSSSGS